MKNYLAYDEINSEYEEFETLKEAQEWLVEAFLGDDGYHPDMTGCKIYRLFQTVDYDVIDRKENYKYMYEEEIPEGDEISVAWPYNSDADEIWKHKFISIEK